MSTHAGRPDRERGQIIVLFALVLVVIVLMAGVVIDGGYGLAQRRTAQNAADFGALAGARIIAENVGGNALDGTDENVMAAIQQAVQANDGAVHGAPVYVGTEGQNLGLVGGGSIPSGSVGVKVSASRTWHPFFTEIVGLDSWTASASATAKGGYYDGSYSGVFPAGISQAFFDNRSPCSGPESADPTSPCYPHQFTDGDWNVPGGFAWLKFGCDGYGLGQVAPANAGGCKNSATFLASEIGPPANSYGCCTKVGLPGSKDWIGSLTGNIVSADCSYYIEHQTLAIVAVWDVAEGNGSNGYYHIVGFTGWQITGCNGGKDLSGIWRQPMWSGPTTLNATAGSTLAVQLVQ